jgi:hypothetical protein
MNVRLIDRIRINILKFFVIFLGQIIVELFFSLWQVMYADVYQRELTRWVQEREAKEMEAKHQLLMPSVASEENQEGAAQLLSNPNIFSQSSANQERIDQSLTNQERVCPLLANEEGISQSLTYQERTSVLLANHEHIVIEELSTQITANTMPSKDSNTGDKKEPDLLDKLDEAVSNLSIGGDKEASSQMSNQSCKGKHENWGRQRVVSGLGLFLNQLKGDGENSDMQHVGRSVTVSVNNRDNERCGIKFLILYR